MDNLRRFGITLVAILAIGGSLASGSSSSDSGTPSDGDTGTSSGGDKKDAGESDEVDDVKITDCSVESVLNMPEATIKVTNNSEKASDYTIEVTFESKNGKTQYGTGFTFISNLKPGQTKNETVSALEEADGSNVTCEVSSVDRSESM